MTGFSRNIISKLYDTFECNILKDYKSSIEIIQKKIEFIGSEIIVDIGGGTGFILKKLFTNVGKSINIDVSEQMLLQQKNNEIYRLQADGSQLPLSNESVDIIFLLNVLHHIDKEKHRSLFEEIYRVLKNNGVFFIIDLYYPMTFLNRLFTKVEEFSVGKTYHVSTNQIQRHLKEVKLNQYSINYLDEHQWNFAIKAIKKKDRKMSITCTHTP